MEDKYAVINQNKHWLSYNDFATAILKTCDAVTNKEIQEFYEGWQQFIVETLSKLFEVL